MQIASVGIDLGKNTEECRSKNGSMIAN